MAIEFENDLRSNYSNRIDLTNFGSVRKIETMIFRGYAINRQGGGNEALNLLSLHCLQSKNGFLSDKDTCYEIRIQSKAIIFNYTRHNMDTRCHFELFIKFKMVRANGRLLFTKGL